MTGRFDSFVMFAEMRTGSNLLETHLNAMEGVTCHGEAFNPAFIGYPNRDDILGISKKQREQKPDLLVQAIRNADGLNGFRYFHEHDPRIFAGIIADERCAKIILTRNPLDSFVSLQIARATNQWKLTDETRRKTSQIRFQPRKYAKFLADLQAFQQDLRGALQRAGQAPFCVDYDDLNSLDVLNGIAAYLGAPALSELSSELKRQNPAPLSSKVSNYAEMQAALGKVEQIDEQDIASTEPARNAAVPSYIAAAETGLLYHPIPGGPIAKVTHWLAQVDGVATADLLTDFSQKTVRRWKRNRTPNRTFTVVCHPVERAHRVFCERILSVDEASFPVIRQNLIENYDITLPKDGRRSSGYGPDEHRVGFLKFLEFIKANLEGKTSIRVDPNWASQSSILQGFSTFMSPDMVIRAAELSEGLAYLSAQVKSACPALTQPDTSAEFELAEIYDAEVERACREAYQRDYMAFGFSAWKN